MNRQQKELNKKQQGNVDKSGSGGGQKGMQKQSDRDTGIKKNEQQKKPQ